jgi:curli production assembly/transport component CsgG
MGMSVFGIGASTQYQSDTVTINLRTVSVSTGEILTNVTVTKTVLSYMDKLTVMRWFNSGTDTLESELGGSINESVNKAVDVAIQAAVVQTINDGAKKGHWSFKDETVSQPKEKNDELVQNNTKTEKKADTPAPSPTRPDSTAGNVGTAGGTATEGAKQ